MSADDLIMARFLMSGDRAMQDAFNRIGAAAGGAEDKLQGFERTSRLLGGALALGGLNLASSKLIEMGNEAANVSAKLDGMLRVRGETGARGELDGLAASLSRATGIDDDLFTDAQAHLLSFGLSAKQIAQIMPGLTGQANTMGQSLDGVADAFGRAFASGNAGALTRSGVVLSKADKDAIDAAKSISEAAGQQELFNRVLGSYAQFAVHAGEGITNAARAQGNFNTQLGNMMETIGTGASEARGKWQGSITPIIEGMNRENEGLLKNIGATIEYATVIGNVAGPVYGVAKAFGELRNYQNLAKLAQIGETAAEEAKIAVAGQHGNAMGALTQKLGDTSKATRVLAGDTVDAAGKLTMLGRVQALLQKPITVGGLQMLGGAPVTVGGAALGGALGIGAGVGARNDMKALGYGEAGSDIYGLGTGLATGAAALFISGAAFPLALALGARKMMEHISDITERDAREATRDADGNVIDNPAKLKGSKANRAAEAARRAIEIDAAADRINPMWDIRGSGVAQDEKDKLKAEAEGWRRVAGTLGRQAKEDNVRQEWNATFNDPETRRKAQHLANQNYAAFLQQQGIDRSQLGRVDNSPQMQNSQRLRNGETVVTLRIPESPADRSERRLRSSTMTAAPNYA